jgi:hypothetical protein
MRSMVLQFEGNEMNYKNKTISGSKQQLKQSGYT